MCFCSNISAHVVCHTSDTVPSGQSQYCNTKKLISPCLLLKTIISSYLIRKNEATNKVMFKDLTVLAVTN